MDGGWGPPRRGWPRPEPRRRAVRRWRWGRGRRRRRASAECWYGTWPVSPGWGRRAGPGDAPQLTPDRLRFGSSAVVVRLWPRSSAPEAAVHARARPYRLAHAHRGPRTAGGPDDDSRPGRRAGRQGTPAPGRPGGRALRAWSAPTGCRSRCGTAIRRPSARKSLQAHVVRLRSALEPDRPAGLDRPVRRPPRPGLRPRAGRGRRSTPCASATSPRGAAPSSPPGDPDEAARHLRRAPSTSGGASPTPTGRTRRFAEAERRRLAEVRGGRRRRAPRGAARAGPARRGRCPNWSGWSPRSRCGRTGGGC